MALGKITFPLDPVVLVHIIINCVIVFLTLLVVGLRMLARYLAGANLWWDDYLVLLAVPQGIGMLVIQGLYAPLGVGYPITQTLPNFEAILKLTTAYAYIYTSCISFVKLSVLFFYLRVFVNEGLCLAAKITIGLVGVWTLANVLLLTFICRPFDARFDPLRTITECGDQTMAIISIGIFNIISDFVILLLPIPTIWMLKARAQMKIAITVVLLIGLLVSIAAIVRIFAMDAMDDIDITGTMVWVDFLSTTEVNLGILCVSLPMLGTLVTRQYRKRGASKLADSEPTPGAGNGNSDGSRYSAKSRINKRHGPDTIVLESIYAHSAKINHEAVVASAQEGETELCEDQRSTTREDSQESLHLRDSGTITVQRRWDARHG